MNPKTVGIFIFDEVEVLDFCGPFEVFSIAGRPQGRELFEVHTVAENPGAVSTRGGMSVNPHYSFASAPDFDILLIPGGYGTRPLLENAAVLEWIEARSHGVELLLSVCTGSLLLAKLRLLDGLAATTHHAAIDLLRELAPDTRIDPSERFIDNGKVIVSAGISAGIDMSLYVVARLHGIDEAVSTAQYMEYDWRPEPPS